MLPLGAFPNYFVNSNGWQKVSAVERDRIGEMSRRKNSYQREKDWNSGANTLKWKERKKAKEFEWYRSWLACKQSLDSTSTCLYVCVCVSVLFVCILSCASYLKLVTACNLQKSTSGNFICINFSVQFFLRRFLLAQNNLLINVVVLQFFKLKSFPSVCLFLLFFFCCSIVREKAYCINCVKKTVTTTTTTAAASNKISRKTKRNGLVC